MTTPSPAPPTVSSQLATIAGPGNPFALSCGGELSHAELSYETWGTLNEDKSNAILVFHALSGSHHLAGYNPENPAADPLWEPELYHGWWEEIVGPGKAIDTDRFFVICFNYLGGCYGSTGPRSIDPATDQPPFTPSVPVQRRLQCPRGKSKFLAASSSLAASQPANGGSPCIRSVVGRIVGL